MERRRSYRKTVSLKAQFTSDSKSCTGFINNISKDGILVRTRPMAAIKDFAQGKMLELTFNPVLAKALNLNCRIKWSCKNPPLGLTESIGIKIINPPSKYIEFLKTL